MQSTESMTYSIKEAAVYLGLTEGSIYRLAYDQRLIGEKRQVGKRQYWFFTQEQLDAFKEAQQAKAAALSLQSEAAPEIPVQAAHSIAPAASAKEGAEMDDAIRHISQIVETAKRQSCRTTRLIDHLKDIAEQISAAIAEYEAGEE